MDRWTGLPSAGTPSRGWGARAYSCNRGQRCHKYDEGSTRLISPHFAIPISGWTRARIHVGPGGRQGRRRRPFHRRKPVLAVRQGGSMPCNGFTTPTNSPERQANSPRRHARRPLQHSNSRNNFLCYRTTVEVVQVRVIARCIDFRCRSGRFPSVLLTLFTLATYSNSPLAPQKPYGPRHSRRVPSAEDAYIYLGFSQN